MPIAASLEGISKMPSRGKRNRTVALHQEDDLTKQIQKELVKYFGYRPKPSGQPAAAASARKGAGSYMGGNGRSTPT